MLAANPSAPALSLMSRQVYGDFVLRLDWRLPIAGNSGILYRVREDGAEPWDTGPEMQLVDVSHPDAKRNETACGALYDLIGPTNPPELASGEFHAACVRVQDGHVEHWLADRCVVRYGIESQTFREAVTRSKFKDRPAFARARRGHIVLQHHGTHASFRNVAIRAFD